MVYLCWRTLLPFFLLMAFRKVPSLLLIFLSEKKWIRELHLLLDTQLCRERVVYPFGTQT